MRFTSILFAYSWVRVASRLESGVWFWDIFVDNHKEAMNGAIG
jgi:hypothetical protein